MSIGTRPTSAVIATELVKVELAAIVKNGVAVLNIALLPVLDCNPSLDFRMSFTLLSKVLGKPIPAPFTPIPCRAFPCLSVVGISLGFTQLIPPRVST